MSRTLTSTPTVKPRMRTRLSTDGEERSNTSPTKSPWKTPPPAPPAINIMHASLTPGYSTPVRKKTTPLTPMHRSVVMNMKQRLEQQATPYTPGATAEGNMRENADWGDDEDDCSSKTSPGLASLRNTPGLLKERQEILIKKHKVSRNNADQLGVGGGYTMWPGMDSMRLSQDESLWLLAVCVALVMTTLVLFHKLHGKTLTDLRHYFQLITDFHDQHTVTAQNQQSRFNQSVLSWHADLKNIMDEIHRTFDVSLSETPLTYQLCVLLYTSGVAMLLYYLADNICSENKLSPRRIKIWMSLLVVIGTWTLLAIKLLWFAQRLEYSIDEVIHKYITNMADLVHTGLDLKLYNNVLQYWRLEYLPPTGRGPLTVFGVLPVRDLTYYLQYYSVPVFTAIMTPILQVILALKNVYITKTP